jgi:hypothetical protein
VNGDLIPTLLQQLHSLANSAGAGTGTFDNDTVSFKVFGQLFFLLLLWYSLQRDHGFHGFLGKTIEKRKLVIDVKYFFFYVHSEPRDIYGETSCLATGDFMLSHQ